MNCPHCKAPIASDARFCGSCGKATQSTEPISHPGITEGPQMIGREIAGRYRIQAKLGEGGMGAVYKAEQISLKRAVAIKLLRAEVSNSPLLLRRFNAEAELVAKLSHPNTVNIYDFGQDSDGTLFIAMEFIEGRSLRAAIQAEAPFGLARAMSIAGQVAASLSDAHAHSIIHRDLKPDNVMLQSRGRARDVVRVLDFGIAKLRDDQRATQQAMTQAGDMLGTPQYMAPEQIRGETIDGRTDVYAMGCMIYEMVTGRLPFEGPTIMALLSKHLTEPPVPPSQRRPDLGIPPHVDELVLSAMAKDARQRPPTMDQLGERIAGVLATVPPDPGQLSAVVGVPAVNTPTPGGAMAVHAMPTPQVYGGPATPAPGYTPTPPPAFPPPPGPPPPGPAPYGTPPPGMAFGMSGTPRPCPGRSSKLALWIVLGAIVLGGGGAAAYFATRPAKAAHDAGTTDEEDEEDTGDSSSSAMIKHARQLKKRVCACKDHACTEGLQDELMELAQEMQRDAMKMNLDDAQKLQKLYQELATCLANVGQGEAPEPGPSGGGVAGEPVEVGGGVKLIVPPGFTHQKTPRGVVATDRRGIKIEAAAITSASEDPTELAQTYARATGMTLDGVSTGQIQDALRPIAVFHGTANGVPVRQVAVIYFGEGYKIAAVLQVPANLANDPGVRALGDEIGERRIVLP